jgi:hypothetical protein
MRTIKYLLVSVFVLALLVNCSKEDDGNNRGFSLKASDTLDDLDYHIYSRMMDELFDAENLVVVQETQAVNHDRAYFQYLKENYPEMDTTVISDFMLKNDTVYSLENKFNVPAKDVSLVSTEEMEYIFNNSDINKGWEEFYRIFPNSAGEIRFTRIGYNTDKTQAMAELGNMYASQGGAGSLILLKLEYNRWIIAAEMPTWGIRSQFSPD